MFRRKKNVVEKKASRTSESILLLNGIQEIAPFENYATIVKEAYKQNPYVYRAINFIADTISSLQFVLLDGDTEITSHKILDLLRNPNPYQGKSAFWSQYVIHLYLGGEAFVEGVRVNGKFTQLYNHRPDRVYLEKGSKQMMVKNYIYKTGAGKDAVIPSEDMSFLKMYNPYDDWRGLSPVTAASLAVDQNGMAKKWNISFLKNGANPSGILEIESEVTDDQFNRLRAELDANNGGFNNSGRPMLLEGGLKWKQTSTNPLEMQWLDGQRLTAKEIGIALGVPIQLLGDSKSATYTNYKEARKAFYEETVIPIIDRILDEMNKWLVPVFDKTLRLDINRNIEALSEDRNSVWERAMKAWENGLITKNEARHIMGMSAITSGNVFKIGRNTSYLDESNKYLDLKREELGENTSVEPVTDEIEPVDVEESIKKIKELIETKTDLLNPFDYALIELVIAQISVEQMKETLKDPYLELIKKEGAITSASLPGTNVFRIENPAVEVYMNDLVGNKIAGITETLKNSLRTQMIAGYKEGENITQLIKRVNDVFKDYKDLSGTELERIARTETMRSLNFANNEALVQAGIQEKQWITTRDGRERNTHAELDFTVVKMSENFVSSSGATAPHPQAFGVAEEDINCRCTMVAVIDGEPLTKNADEFWETKNTAAINYENTFKRAYAKAFQIQQDKISEVLKEMS